MKTHGSLFSGVGGFDVAAQWMGWENVFHCEINDFGQKVLKYYWPNAISYEDITKTDFTIWKGKIDILTGGFPCQPYSTAGKRLGKEDERHLWPEMLRAIREIQPRWVVGENVRGLINWSGGLVFDEVQADLEAEGYEVTPFILPACGKNAPHRRDRIFFVAYADKCTARPPGTSGKTESNGSKNNDEQSSWGKPTKQFVGRGDVSRPFTYANSNGHKLRGFGKNRQTESQSKGKKNKRQRVWPDNRRTGKQGITANARLQRPEKRQEQAMGTEQLCKKQSFTNSKGSSITGKLSERQEEGKFRRCDRQNDAPNTKCQRQQEQGQPKRPLHKEAGREWKASWAYDNGRWPTQSPVCSRDDGFSGGLPGITISKHRIESIKAYGNAIVPQVVYEIFKAIESYETIS